MKKQTVFTALVATLNGEKREDDAVVITFRVTHPDYYAAHYIVRLHDDGEGMSWNRSEVIPSADRMLSNAVALGFAKRLFAQAVKAKKAYQADRNTWTETYPGVMQVGSMVEDYIRRQAELRKGA